MSAQRRPKKILVVEDNRDIANAMSLMLRLWGHDVEVSYDGRTGVEAACRLQPDLVLMDVGLPGLNGFEAAKLIREQLGEQVRLVAVSAADGDTDRETAMKSGFDKFIAKPPSVEALRSLIESLPD